MDMPFGEFVESWLIPILAFASPALFFAVIAASTVGEHRKRAVDFGDYICWFLCGLGIVIGLFGIIIFFNWTGPRAKEGEPMPLLFKGELYRYLVLLPGSTTIMLFLGATLAVFGFPKHWR